MMVVGVAGAGLQRMVRQCAVCTTAMRAPHAAETGLIFPSSCLGALPALCRCLQEKFDDARERAGDAYEDVKERASDAMQNVKVGGAGCPRGVGACSCHVPAPGCFRCCSCQPARLCMPHRAAVLPEPMLPLLLTGLSLSLSCCRTVPPTWQTAPGRRARMQPTLPPTRWTRLQTRCASKATGGPSQRSCTRRR